MFTSPDIVNDKIVCVLAYVDASTHVRVLHVCMPVYVSAPILDLSTLLTVMLADNGQCNVRDSDY